MTRPSVVHIANAPASGPIVFGAVGDIALRRGVAEAMSSRGMDWPFQAMRSQLDRAHVLFANMETVLIPDDYPRAQIDPLGLIAPFRAEHCAAALERAGFDFLNLAANHVLDAGVIGLEHTQKVLEAGGIATGGVGPNQAAARKPVILVAGELRIGMLCYCEDSNYSLGTPGPCHAYYEPSVVLEDIAAIRDDVDVVVVSVHADLEFMPTPSTPRREAFRQFAEAGAGLVLGHHPHVAQGCERVGRSLIAYSLGNFVFPAHSSPYMRAHGPATAQSFLLLVELTRDGAGAYERVPFTIGEPPDERPAACGGAERESRLAQLEELDQLLADDAAVARIWREFALRKLEMEFGKAVTLERRPTSWWRHGVARVFGLRPPTEVRVDVERMLEELVGRWWLTAENRAWMDEVICAGSERWIQRNAEEPDRLHRPHHRFENR